MDYKKVKAENTTITRDLDQFDGKTGNIYEATVILSRRANQIGIEMRDELHNKLDDFATTQDNLEEIFENREQIEIAKFYEKLPKPTLISIYDFLNEKIYFRNPIKENSKNNF